MHAGLLALLLLNGAPPQAQNYQDATNKGGVPGLHLSPVPAFAYSQLPELPRDAGLVVDEIDKSSPAASWPIQRHDILLSLDGQALRDGNHLNRLIQLLPAASKSKLVVFRAGKQHSLEIAVRNNDVANTTPKSTVKSSPPPVVEVECTLLDGGRLRIVLLYYSESTSKLETVTCSGLLPEIETQVRDQQLPPRVRELVDVALKRLRTRQ